MSTNYGLSEEEVLFQKFIHALAADAKALDKTLRQLMTTFLSQGGIEDGAGDYSLSSNFKIYSGYLATEPHALRSLLLRVLREVDRSNLFVLNVAGFWSKGSNLVVRKMPINLVEIIEEAADMYEFAAKEKVIEIKTSTRNDSEPTIRADRSLVFRMLSNLIDNAVKYSYEGAEGERERFIDIKARRHTPQGSWIVEVASFGVGISADELRSGKLFEYGVRGENAEDRGRTGSGIGLAEAKKIAEAHGGSIWLTSEKKGEKISLTTVHVVLPK